MEILLWKCLRNPTKNSWRNADALREIPKSILEEITIGISEGIEERFLEEFLHEYLTKFLPGLPRSTSNDFSRIFFLGIKKETLAGIPSGIFVRIPPAIPEGPNPVLVEFLEEHQQTSLEELLEIF